MGITLQEILNTTPLGKAALLAGREGLCREVLETNIIEVPDTVRWMRGGEVVFSAGYAFGGDGVQGAQLIRELNEHGISALALKPGKYMPVIPQEMIQQAETLGFPLLSLPEDMPYSICAEAIFEKVRSSKIAELRAITDLHATLLEVSMHGGIEQVCKTLEERFFKPVYLWEKSGRVRYGDPDKELAFCWEWLQKVSSNAGMYAVPPEDSTEQTAFFCLPILPDALGAEAFLAVPCPVEGISSGEEAGFQYAASLIGMQLLQEQALAQQYMRLSGTLLDHLLEGDLSDQAILRRHAEPYRVDLGADHILFAAANIDGSLPPQEKLWNLLSGKLTEQHIGFLMTGKSNCWVGALFFCGRQGLACQELLRQVVNQGKQDGFSLRFGLSSISSCLEDIPKLAREAEEALQVLCKVQGAGDVSALSELGIYRILSELMDTETMQKLCHQVLGSVYRYDRELNGDLIHTLRAYYANERNLRKTADAMFLHKNSISYRLRKVEELTGHSLDDEKFSLELQFCLRFAELACPCSESTIGEAEF